MHGVQAPMQKLFYYERDSSAPRHSQKRLLRIRRCKAA